MKKMTGVSEEDRKLFRGAVKGVKPLKQDKLILEKSKARPTVRDKDVHIEKDEAPEKVRVACTGTLSFYHPGVQKKTLKRLQRGQSKIEDKLDLHGMKSEEARQKLGVFLQQCVEQNKRYVMIIHGKGQHSKDSIPILKNRLDDWLLEIKHVLACCPARQIDGGAGAVYLLLKKTVD